MIAWEDLIGLGEYGSHLKGLGVHGGVLALDVDYDHEKLALALQIPSSNYEVPVTCMHVCTSVHVFVIYMYSTLHAEHLLWL